MPYDSGLLSVIKAHGYFRVDKNNYCLNKPEDLLNEIIWTNGKAVLLIRNPYRAIYSYRNHILTKNVRLHGDISGFIGQGIL